MTRSDTFVVIAAYNEETGLSAILHSLLPHNYRIVVVDDGSSDRTYELASRFPIHVLRHATNCGQGAALQTGTEYALRRGARIVVHFDADGQHRPDDLAGLVAPIESQTADVVLGSRFIRLEDVSAVPFRRRVLLRGAVIVNGFLTGLWLSDAHNGLRALSRKAAEAITLREAGSAHATEILAQIKRAGLAYTERPVSILYTTYSVSKGQSGWASINVLIDSILGRIFR